MPFSEIKKNQLEQDKTLEPEDEKPAQEGWELLVEAQEKESRQSFADKIGVSFSKGEMSVVNPQEQADFILNSEAKTAQFWVGKGREVEDYIQIIDQMREKRSDIKISTHVDSPSLGSDLEIKNADKLSQDILKMAQNDCPLVTIHPGSIPMEIWQKVPKEVQEKVVESLAKFYAKNIAQARDADKILELAIENLPAKGEVGNWGQNPESLVLIIEKTRKILIMDYGFGVEDVVVTVGLTLDINHALTGTSDDQKAEKLEQWFKVLSQDIKCFHVYTPSASEDGVYSVNNQLELLRQLCDKYHIRPEVFLESKKDMENTEKIYAAGKESILRDHKE